MKKAYLVYFNPGTRVITEEGANENTIIQQARAQMLKDIPSYLNGNNVEIEEDYECPYDPKNDDKEESLCIH